MGAVDFATTIAPGLRDVLITGKVKEAVTRRVGGRRVYDAVVVDAPPTGRITRFLNVTSEMAGLARSGPIKTQSDGVMAVIRSPQTAVHLVTLLEDMPAQETADARPAPGAPPPPAAAGRRREAGRPRPADGGAPGPPARGHAGAGDRRRQRRAPGGPPAGRV